MAMAMSMVAYCSLHFLLLLIFSFLCSFRAHGLIFHVTKDGSTLQYLTKVHLGTPLVPTNLVIDLGGPFLWLNCASSSSSSRLISKASIQCLAAKPKPHDRRTSSNSNNRCHIFPENKVSQIVTQGDLVQDIVAVEGNDGSSSKTGSTSITTVDYNFLFSCAPMLLLNGLASGAKGMLGLGRTRISMASQISTQFNSKFQFFLCLSSSNGVVLYNNGQIDSLTYTPLVTTQIDSPHEYFIKLKAIKISGKKLSITKNGLVEGIIKLSTIVPYTTMESSIYSTFLKAYEQAGRSMNNMTKVAPVAPFGLCFRSTKMDGKMVIDIGSEVPVIDLVLQSEMVKWRIHGRNSMVEVSNEVMCLGFLDGGQNLNTSIVIGGYQLEDMLLHFDIGSSMLGFGHKSCSDLRLDYGFKESL